MARRVLRGQPQILLGPLKGRHYKKAELPFSLGIYELHIQLAVVDALAGGDVFYDVGANNGYLSLLGAQRVGPNGFVYAFEPLPPNISLLQELMSENGIDNYKLVPHAISNVSGAVDFYFGDSNATPSLISGNRDQRLSILTTTLDQFAAEYRWPNVIKMDIEGAEVMALEGASKLLASDRAPSWIIEIHSREIEHSVNDLLVSNGFHINALLPPYPNPKLYPRQILAWKNRRI